MLVARPGAQGAAGAESKQPLPSTQPLKTGPAEQQRGGWRGATAATAKAPARAAGRPGSRHAGGVGAVASGGDDRHPIRRHSATDCRDPPAVIRLADRPEPGRSHLVDRFSRRHRVVALRARGRWDDRPPPRPEPGVARPGGSKPRGAALRRHRRHRHDCPDGDQHPQRRKNPGGRYRALGSAAGVHARAGADGATYPDVGTGSDPAVRRLEHGRVACLCKAAPLLRTTTAW